MKVIYHHYFDDQTEYETYASVHETTCEKKQNIQEVNKLCDDEKINCKELTAKTCESSSIVKIDKLITPYNCCEESKNDKQNGRCKKITSFAEKCAHKLNDCNTVKDKSSCDKIKLESGLHEGKACCTWNAKDTKKKQDITTTVSDKGQSNFKTVTITHTAMENTYPKDLCLKNLFEIPLDTTTGTGILTRCLGQCQYSASCNSAKIPLTIKVPNVQKLGFLENRYQRASRMYRWGRPKTFDYRYITQGIAGDFIVNNDSDDSDNPNPTPAQTDLLKYLIGLEDRDPGRNAYGTFDYDTFGINPNVGVLP
ncbi:hypothetical protein TrLO_g9281 [Triparma laevis f. longispina]|uniref:Uncharacterized protein n=1 Tax=Triparma laevis f. longispina TaxID=1714387 RepID=A0A9W7FPF6_9STRA|nr:hypothetical protein TrLO_g9281 [Triparma laevis f. longispina]